MIIEYEHCVLCGGTTAVTTNTPVGRRSHYVEGCGQLCPACWRDTYGPHLEHSEEKQR